MKIAVIGSGAAAFGVLDRLSLLTPTPEITLIDRGGRPEPIEPSFDCWTEDRLKLFYGQIKKARGNVFPPPKTSIGIAPNVRKVEGWASVWDSSSYGGLTNFWGLSLVPFSSADFQGWPFGRTELDPHYAAIADRIGITGEHDALNNTFGLDFVNRPPITVPRLISALSNQVNSSTPRAAYRFVAGVSRLAVETRKDELKSCVACGECMLGCPRRAMYSTVSDMDAWQRSGLISRVLYACVLAIDRETRTIMIKVGDGLREPVGPFDRIYVCTGCIGTTEIAMRTLGQNAGRRIIDNSAYTFLLIYTRPVLSNSDDQSRYLALTNLLVNAIPLAPAYQAAQMQIYLMFDHLWRYYTPPALWPLMAPLGRAIRRRVLLARIFLHGEHSQRYAVHIDGDRPARLSLEHAGTPLWKIPELWPEIRRNFGGSGFHVPPVKPIRQRTSSHYAGSFPIGVGPVGLDASIARGVYLCDSSVFPTAPASSPTFTIMANARRIADISIR